MQGRAFSKTGWVLISLGLAAIASENVIVDFGDGGTTAITIFSPRLRTALLSRQSPEPPRGTRRDADHLYDAIIHEYAEQYRVEPALVKAVIHVESGFDPEAVSPRGAQGLMQLMPAVARSHGVSNAHDPRENIRAGVRELRALLDRFHDDSRLAIAAYNAGSRSVVRFRGLPPYRETRRYVARVMQVRHRYGAPLRGLARAAA